MRHTFVNYQANPMYASAGRSASISGQSNVQRTLAGRVRDLVGASKATVEISLENERPDNTYTTMDKLQGVVSISAPQNTKFDQVEIFFLGTTFTLVERLGTSMHNSRNEAHHQFLKLTQPIPYSLYPEDGLLQAGKTYKFPFTFCVPEHLLLGACRHMTSSEKLKEAHLQLPPSLNDPDVTPLGVRGTDDMCPEMVRVSYQIRARVLQTRDARDRETLLAEKSKRLRIIPAVEEAPPVTVDSKDLEYCLRKEKPIRKGMFKGRLGRIVMEAAQSKPFCLAPADLFSGTPPTIMATVVLRFDPAEPSAQPPRLGSLTSKLKVVTFYSTTVMRDYPSKATLIYDPTRGQHTESISLSSRNIASVQWHRQEPYSTPSNVLFRRDSAASTTAVSDCPEQSSSYTPDSPFWVAELLVPISLPTDKFYVPTFHSCLVSRIYTLDLQLSVPSPSGGTKGVPTTISLKLPVQVSAARVNDVSSPNTADTTTNEGLMAYYESQVQQAVEDGDDYFFTPRSIVPPPDEYLGTSVLNRTSSGPGTPLEDSMMRPPPRISVLPRRDTIASLGSSDGDGVEDLETSPTSPTAADSRARARDDQQEDLPPDYSYLPPRGSVAVAG